MPEWPRKLSGRQTKHRATERTIHLAFAHVSFLLDASARFREQRLWGKKLATQGGQAYINARANGVGTEVAKRGGL
jgi:hypothetical protein